MKVSPQAAKHSRELKALRYIYDEKAFFSVQHGDRPDFVLQTAPTTRAFGVEVTEIHPSESAARLFHVPGYVLQLIEGRLRHRLDALLTVAPVEFTSPDGRKTSGRAVAIEPMPLRDYLPALAKTIETKRTRATGYRDDLSHTNLVIVDYAAPFVLSAPEIANRLIFDDAVWTAIAGARFNEIYLVTRLTPAPSDPPRTVYLPLRQLWLVATAMMLPSALRKFRPRSRFRDESRWACALWDYLACAGVRGHFHRTGDYAEVVINAIGIRIDSLGAVHAMDYLDVPELPPDVAPRIRANAPWRDPGFEAAFRAHRLHNYIQFSLVMPARVDE